MGYRLLADAAMVTHFAFLVYLVTGGFLAWRWRWTIVPHAAMVLWGVLIVTGLVDCPLTWVENWARERAGRPGLPSAGFIDHYIEGVIYPGEHTQQVRLVAAVVVLASWAGYVIRGRGRA
ncbi:DUF2784 domain-containing protein [Longispora albida]|uniref:DUF2784 domain-containing protein n=1 Tax=Longispora albida TaxID=203523 RepID=UPI0003744D1F|nr:DUF2784 domain-containing protein [Longispora albida]